MNRMRVVSVTVASSTLILATLLTAQQAARHPISGRVYAAPMSADGAAWLDRPEREREEEPDHALRLMQLSRGMTVADIGAGSGYFTVRMARAVGDAGRVYASDIQPRMLELLAKSVADARLKNVVPVLGSLDDPRLPAGSLDLALMVDVYHELSQPQTVLRHLRNALKADGRLVLLEYRAEDPAVPIRPEHKMTKAQVKLEIEPEGFVLSKIYDDLPRQHLIVFTKSRN